MTDNIVTLTRKQLPALRNCLKAAGSTTEIPECNTHDFGYDLATESVVVYHLEHVAVEDLNNALDDIEAPLLWVSSKGEPLIYRSFHLKELILTVDCLNGILPGCRQGDGNTLEIDDSYAKSHLIATCATVSSRRRHMSGTDWRLPKRTGLSARESRCLMRRAWSS